MKLSFDPIKSQDPGLQRNLQRIREAIEQLAAAIAPAPTLVSFVRPGLALPGFIALPPVKDPATGNILRRATVGATLVMAVNLTTGQDVQGLFEQTLATSDLIQQTGPGLAGATLALVVASS